MNEEIAEAILYYLPAVIFLAVFVWMNMRIGKIAKSTNELVIHNTAMAESPREIRALLENRKS
ncbi:hypothetical protein [Aestuariivirga sp.]|uniref:hypothetical protein n=1 Tax=Aestuariivirga sp. TaxID=2650926 RepID=UPI0039E50C0E